MSFPLISRPYFHFLQCAVVIYYSGETAKALGHQDEHNTYETKS